MLYQIRRSKFIIPLLTSIYETMNYTPFPHRLSTLYESVCERQRQSGVRNAALLKDVERVQSLLAGHQQCHNQLNALKVCTCTSQSENIDAPRLSAESLPAICCSCVPSVAVKVQRSPRK